VNQPFASPVEVIRNLGSLTAKMDSIVANLREAEHRAAEANAEATVAEAQAFLKAEGAMDVRRFKAKMDARGPLLTAELADVEVRCLKRELQSVMTRIEVGRTYAATVRAELTNLPGVG